MLPADAPPSRRSHGMAYDSARGVVVMFGGNSAGFLDDTWEYDGTTWTEVLPAAKPPPREVMGMTYDPTSARVVMFGGRV